MQVILATELGMCFGVRDALALAAAIEEPREVTIHGELVHNPAVLVQLDARGFARRPERDRGAMPATPAVLITAHGVSDRERARLSAGGKRLIDGTCPLVTRVHRAAQLLQAAGFQVLVIGQPGHVEVEGIVQDLRDAIVLPDVAAVRTFDHARLGVVCQTTAPPRLAEAVVAALRQQNPHAEIRAIDTICEPTRRRQQAMTELLEQVEAVVVVGGRNSNNTRQLVALCSERGVPALHVEQADQLDTAWLSPYRTVGLTAGTSTLDETIEEVRRRLAEMGGERLEAGGWRPEAGRGEANITTLPGDSAC